MKNAARSNTVSWSVSVEQAHLLLEIYDYKIKNQYIFTHEILP